MLCQPHLSYPGAMAPGRWTVVQMPEGRRLLPRNSIYKSDDLGAQLNIPDEMIYAYYREDVIAQAHPRADDGLRSILRFLLDTINHRVQIVVQPLKSFLNPAEDSGAPHPLLMVLGGMLTRERPEAEAKK